MKIVVASGHLLNESLITSKVEPALIADAGLREIHLAHINQSLELNDGKNFPARTGRCGETEWLWYHCGDGNHFCTIFKPQDWERSWHDPVWESWCEKVLGRLEAQGYRVSTVGQLVNSLDYAAARDLPPLVEGSWNSKRSEGVFAWMGNHRTTAADHPAVLSTICRARQRLVQCETGALAAARDQSSPAESGNPRLFGRLRRKYLDRYFRAAARSAFEHSAAFTDAWDCIFRAEISDCLGWYPSRESTAFALAQSERALHLATQFGDRISALDHTSGSTPICDRCSDIALTDQTAFELFGADGAFSTYYVSPAHQIWEASFLANQPCFGVRLPFTPGFIQYCPSGLESLPIKISLDRLKPDVITLPLANGLVALADSLFLVKDTASVHLAARILKRPQLLEFGVRNGAIGRPHTWRFHVVRTSLPEAVRFANELNAATSAFGSAHMGIRDAAVASGR